MELEHALVAPRDQQGQLPDEGADVAAPVFKGVYFGVRPLLKDSIADFGVGVGAERDQHVKGRVQPGQMLGDFVDQVRVVEVQQYSNGWACSVCGVGGGGVGC